MTHVFILQNIQAPYFMPNPPLVETPAVGVHHHCNGSLEIRTGAVQKTDQANLRGAKLCPKVTRKPFR